jgi:hypothetical protein
MNNKIINYKNINNAWDKLKFLATVKDETNKHYIDIQTIRYSEIHVKNTLVFAR